MGTMELIEDVLFFGGDLPDEREQEVKEYIYIHKNKSDSLSFLVEKFQTPKGNYIIDLLIERNKNK